MIYLLTIKNEEIMYLQEKTPVVVTNLSIDLE